MHKSIYDTFFFFAKWDGNFIYRYEHVQTFETLFGEIWNILQWCYFLTTVLQFCSARMVIFCKALIKCSINSMEQKVPLYYNFYSKIYLLKLGKKRWSNMQIFGLMLKTTLVICRDSRDFVKIFSAGNFEDKKSNVEQKNLKISKLVELNQWKVVLFRYYLMSTYLLIENPFTFTKLIKPLKIIQSNKDRDKIITLPIAYLNLPILCVTLKYFINSIVCVKNVTAMENSYCYFLIAIFVSEVLKHYRDKICVAKWLKLLNLTMKQLKKHLTQQLNDQEVILFFYYFQVKIDFFKQKIYLLLTLLHFYQTLTKL